jgi:hypothetical protein
MNLSVPSGPILTVPIPNLSMSVAEKALGEASAAPLPSGGMKDKSFPSNENLCNACAANCYNFLYKSYIVIKFL